MFRTFRACLASLRRRKRLFREYDVVRLRRLVPTIPLPIGAQGTIVIDHRSRPPAYLVEFFSDGEHAGLYDVVPEDIELMIPYEGWFVKGSPRELSRHAVPARSDWRLK
ncbi:MULTISPECIES: DUF4926 domain-containing protein [unclassified Bradyrhizobium]|uniref:DUF4926 domain-containing protein n=2 Tax=Bradyrhizobium TaxID=374 RepID=UPI0039655EC9